MHTTSRRACVCLIRTARIEQAPPAKLLQPFFPCFERALPEKGLGHAERPDPWPSHQRKERALYTWYLHYLAVHISSFSPTQLLPLEFKNNMQIRKFSALDLTQTVESSKKKHEPVIISRKKEVQSTKDYLFKINPQCQRGWLC